MDTELEEIWREVLKDYKREFGNDFDPAWSPKTEQDLADKLAASHLDFTSWREKHGKLWRALKATALPISQMGQTASNIASAAFPPASAAVSSLLALVTASQKVSESYDFIEQMFIKLEDVLSRWQVDPERNEDPLLKQKKQQILVVILSIVALSRKRTKGRARHLFKTLVFGKDQQTADLLQKLEDLITSEDRARFTLILAEVRIVHDEITQIKEVRVMEKLNCPAVTANSRIFRETKRDKVAGSGMWLKREPLYQRWSQNDIPLLMVLGGIGSGKSYVATSLIDDLIQHESPDIKGNSISVGYFYFVRGYDLNTMLRVMAYQIQENNLDYHSHVVEALNKDELVTARDVWARLFLDFWNTNENPAAQAILVIDGLNKASPKEIETFALDMVQTMISDSTSRIKLAIFGRGDLHDDAFKFMPVDGIVRIDFEKNRDDLTAYIDRELSKDRLLKKQSNSDAKAELQAGILEHSAETFEWARLLLTRCRRKEISQMREVLKTAPETLGEMIKSCFDQIIEDDALDPCMLKVLFTWLTYQKQTLRFIELYNAISLATGKENDLLWPRIVSKLSSVIRWQGARVKQWTGKVLDLDEDNIESLDKERGWSDQVAKARISFTNSAMRDYVISQSTSPKTVAAENESSPWPWPAQQSECEMIKICFKTLQRDDLLETKNRHLMLYPLECIMLHLQELELAAISLEDKSTIIRGLVWMLCDESSFKIMAFILDGSLMDRPRIFWQTWIETTDNIHMIQNWFRWALQNGFEAEPQTLQWMRTACVSIKSFFAPMADTLRQAWLRGHNSTTSFKGLNEDLAVAAFAPIFLAVYDNMSEQEEFPERYQAYPLMEGYPILAEDIVKSAEISGFQKDGSYFLGLAMAMQHQISSVEALKYLRAVHPDDTYAWISSWRMAEAHAGQHNYEHAIDCASKAVELNTDNRVQMQSVVIDWQLSSNNLNDALSTAKAAYKYDSSNVQIQTKYLFCLALREDLIAIMESIAELDRKPKDDESNTRLIDLIAKGSEFVWRTLLQVCLLSKNSDRALIMKAIDRTKESLLHSEGEMQQTRWLDSYADFLLGFAERDYNQKAVNQLLDNVGRVKESKLSSNEDERTQRLIETSAKAARVLFEVAESQRTASDDGLPSTLGALEKLAIDAQSVSTTQLSYYDGFVAKFPCFAYGRWLHRYSSYDDGSWREYFRPSVLDFLAMFDDAIPQNDTGALRLAMNALYYADEYDQMKEIYVLGVWKTVIDRDRVSRGQSDLKHENTAASSQLSATTNVASENVSKHGSVETQNVQQAMEHLRITDRPDVDCDKLTDGQRDYLPVHLKTDLEFCCSICQANMLYIKGLYLCRKFWCHFCDKCLPQNPIHPILGRRGGNHLQFEQVWPLSKETIDRVGVRKDHHLFIKRSWLESVRNKWRKSEEGVAGKDS